MALTNYSELVAAVENWLARPDLDSYLADFVTLAELRLNRRVRLRGLESALSVTIASGVAALPSDYLQLKEAHLTTTPVTPLERTTLTKLIRKYPTRSADNIPRFVARAGSNFEFGPYPDSNYTMVGIYYVKPTALSADNTENWYMTNVPDLFLFSACLQAAIFTEDSENMQKYEALFTGVLDELELQERNEDLSGSELRSWPG